MTRATKIWLSTTVVLLAVIVALAVVVTLLAVQFQGVERFQMTTNSRHGIRGTSSPIVYKLDKQTGEMWIVEPDGTVKKVDLE